MTTTNAAFDNRARDPLVFAPGELARLAAVKRYDLLETSPDGALDRITAIAARLFSVPVALVSIVDEDRIRFKSHHGLNVDHIGRDPGLCASAILSNGPYIVTDATIDARTLGNPLVGDAFGLRFYAGIPLTTRDGHNLGMFCVMDSAPRTVDPRQIDDLEDLAGLVMDHLELRIAALNAGRQASLMAREIDHRVMNSLQLVASLLSMQSRLPNLVSAKDHLKLAANRVNAVAQVHRHFSFETEATACLSFLLRLCEDLGAILDRTIMVTGDEDVVPTRWIQPIGLLTNELVTNAAKYGDGVITVDFRRDDAGHVLTVCDEGRNLPEDFDPSAASTSLGMRVVTALVGQLQGTLYAGRRDDGSTCFSITIPASPVTAAAQGDVSK